MVYQAKRYQLPSNWKRWAHHVKRVWRETLQEKNQNNENSLAVVEQIARWTTYTTTTVLLRHGKTKGKNKPTFLQFNAPIQISQESKFNRNRLYPENGNIPFGKEPTIKLISKPRNITTQEIQRKIYWTATLLNAPAKRLALLFLLFSGYHLRLFHNSGNLLHNGRRQSVQRKRAVCNYWRFLKRLNSPEF